MSKVIRVVIKKNATSKPIRVVLRNFPKWFPVYLRSEITLLSQCSATLYIKTYVEDEFVLEDFCTAYLKFISNAKSKIGLSSECSASMNIETNAKSELNLESKCNAHMTIKAFGECAIFKLISTCTAFVGIFKKLTHINDKKLKEVNEMTLGEICMDTIE